MCFCCCVCVMVAVPGEHLQCSVCYYGGNGGHRGDLVFESLARDVCGAQYVFHGIYVQFM